MGSCSLETHTSFYRRSLGRLLPATRTGPTCNLRVRRGCPLWSAISLSLTAARDDFLLSFSFVKKIVRLRTTLFFFASLKLSKSLDRARKKTHVKNNKCLRVCVGVLDPSTGTASTPKRRKSRERGTSGSRRFGLCGRH